MNLFSRSIVDWVCRALHRVDLKQFTIGAAALACFAVHAAVQLHAGKPYNLLWACHAAALLVAVGALLRTPLLVAAGVLLLTIGVPAWLINLGFGGTFYATSILTHLGGWSCGFASLRLDRRMPQQSACAALVAVAVLLLGARFLTPSAPNVNLAHAPWRVLPDSISSWEAHIVLLLFTWAVLIFLADVATRRLVAWLAVRLPGS